jgi:hypothetical protein
MSILQKYIFEKGIINLIQKYKQIRVEEILKTLNNIRISYKTIVSLVTVVCITTSSHLIIFYEYYDQIIKYYINTKHNKIDDHEKYLNTLKTKLLKNPTDCIYECFDVKKKETISNIKLYELIQNYNTETYYIFSSLRVTRYCGNAHEMIKKRFMSICDKFKETLRNELKSTEVACIIKTFVVIIINKMF